MNRSEILAKFRDKASKNQIQDEDILAMVNNIGGINSLVELCLNNSNYCEQNITNDNIENLSSLLSSNPTTITTTLATLALPPPNIIKHQNTDLNDESQLQREATILTMNNTTHYSINKFPNIEPSSGSTVKTIFISNIYHSMWHPTYITTYY